MILAPTNRRVIRPYDKPSFEHTQRYGLIRGHWANVNRVGLWIFNERSGRKVLDLSGHNRNGILNGNVSWIGEGLLSDGVDDYVDFGNNTFGRF